MDKKCVGCEKILPLDGFSKNARKSGDKAVSVSMVSVHCLTTTEMY